MITAAEAIAYARSRIGTPYGSKPGQLDCINLIKDIIRNCPGGQKKYTDAGTASLWASYNSSGKYKHLVMRKENTDGARAGMLIFKGQPLGRDGQPHHVGIVTEIGTVVHASSTMGAVVETPIEASWTLLGVSRYIEDSTTVPQNQEDTMEAPKTPYRAIVTGPEGAHDVFLRRGPGKDCDWFQRVPIGAEITVISEFPDWAFIQWDTYTGYMAAEFIRPEPEEDAGEDPADNLPAGWFEDPSFVSESGSVIKLVGRWRIAMD